MTENGSSNEDDGCISNEDVLIKLAALLRDVNMILKYVGSICIRQQVRIEFAITWASLNNQNSCAPVSFAAIQQELI